jgi:hypothetical protein
MSDPFNDKIIRACKKVRSDAEVARDAFGKLSIVWSVEGVFRERDRIFPAFVRLDTKACNLLTCRVLGPISEGTA